MPIDKLSKLLSVVRKYTQDVSIVNGSIFFETPWRVTEADANTLEVLGCVSSDEVNWTLTL